MSATYGPSPIRDDVRYYQISAAVQPGNSGGPMLDMSGHLVGIITAKLDFRVAGLTGAIPENVNFAAKGEILKLFLHAHGIAFQEVQPGKPRKIEEVVAAARRFTAQITCSAPTRRAKAGQPSSKPSKVVPRASNPPTESSTLKGMNPDWLKPR